MRDKVMEKVFAAISEHDDFDEMVAKAAIKLAWSGLVRLHPQRGFVMQFGPDVYTSSGRFLDQDAAWLEEEDSIQDVLERIDPKEAPAIIAALREQIDKFEAELAR